jgi:DNA-binding MarR family transcriptional regulator
LTKKKLLDRSRFVPFLLEVITNRIGANATRIYQEMFGLGLAEWRVLSGLALEPGMTVMGLSDQSGIDAGAVSRVVFSLGQSGYISHQIDRTDRRRRKLLLTKTGWDLHDAMIRVALAEEERLLRELDGEERRDLIAILQKLYARLNHRKSSVIKERATAVASVFADDLRP